MKALDMYFLACPGTSWTNDRHGWWLTFSSLSTDKWSQPLDGSKVINDASLLPCALWLPESSAYYPDMLLLTFLIHGFVMIMILHLYCILARLFIHNGHYVLPCTIRRQSVSMTVNAIVLNRAYSYLYMQSPWPNEGSGNRKILLKSDLSALRNS